MDAATNWKTYFSKWPSEIPRRGVLVTSYDEQIPFDGFLTGEHQLLVERRTPDTSGARQVIVGYESVVAIKITDVIKTKAFYALGFTPDRSAKAMERALHD